jgi:hypothetical protein
LIATSISLRRSSSRSFNASEAMFGGGFRLARWSGSAPSLLKAGMERYKRAGIDAADIETNAHLTAGGTALAGGRGGWSTVRARIVAGARHGAEPQAPSTVEPGPDCTPAPPVFCRLRRTSGQAATVTNGHRLRSRASAT